MSMASLFNLAAPDLIIVLVITLLLFGVRKLPELAKGMEQAVRDWIGAKDGPLPWDLVFALLLTLFLLVFAAWAKAGR